MTDLAELLDLLDLSVSRAAGIATPAEVGTAASTARTARDRRGFPGDTVVIAIAGGTGTGKSSTLNAIAGTEVAPIGVLRPHTDAPLAWAPGVGGGGIDALLDHLGVAARVKNDSIPGIVLIDLPDLDSMAAWHRRMVEDLLPGVDAVLWVVDPMKYRDPSLHEEFLARLAGHHRQFLFVLNQVDLVEAEAANRIESDLVEALVADGHPNPVVFRLAAAPRVGVPRGVEPLRRHLAERVDAKSTVLSGLVADIRAAGRELARSARLWKGAGVAMHLEPGETSVAAAAEEFVDHVAERVGPVTGARLRSEGLSASNVPAELRRILGDRALLGATIAQLGVACAEAEDEIERRRT